MNMDQEKEYETLRKALPIHIDGLHNDAKYQPSLAVRAGELAADLKAEVRGKRIELEGWKADLNREVRIKPESFRIAKITEAVVASVVNSHKDVLRMAKELTEAERQSDRALALAGAYEHRRAMIKVEVELYKSNYWGDVEVRERDLAPAVADLKEKKRKEFEEQLGEKIEKGRGMRR